ncbi:Olfactory Receptor 2T8 [Manis pentadactyla]|nr:Olfactory Receptor 2T8 [Manis pentadactyla]
MLLRGDADPVMLEVIIFIIMVLQLETMENKNATSYFILLGLFNRSGAHLFLFVMILAVAFTSLLGNALVILLIHRDPRLHTPMYFPLSQLSLMDVMLVCTIVPKMAADYMTGRKSISPTGRGVQIFFLLTLGGVAFTSLGGNAFMILLIHRDPWLHMPMYFLILFFITLEGGECFLLATMSYDG